MNSLFFHEFSIFGRLNHTTGAAESSDWAFVVVSQVMGKRALPSQLNAAAARRVQRGYSVGDGGWRDNPFSDECVLKANRNQYIVHVRNLL